MAYFSSARYYKADEVYVVGHDKQTYTEVKEDLFRRLGKERVNVLDLEIKKY